MGRAAGPVDWWVGEAVIGRMSQPDAAELLADDNRPDAAALRREAKVIRGRLDGLARLLADDVLTEVGVRQESARLRGQLAVVEGKQSDAGRVNVLGPLVAAEDVPAAATVGKLDYQVCDQCRCGYVRQLDVSDRYRGLGLGTRAIRVARRGRDGYQWSTTAQYPTNGTFWAAVGFPEDHDGACPRMQHRTVTQN